MSEINISSVITISQETINEIADRIFDRFKELADSCNESKDKPCEESFELAQEPEEPKKIVKHRRHQSKCLVVDGAKMSFQNLSHIFKTFKLANTADTATKRDVRKRMRVIIVDGVCYKFKSAKEMMSYFSLDSCYDTFIHLVQNKGGRENTVEYEADALHRLLLKAGLHLDSYQASCFDGRIRTVMFDKEKKESANA